jgi:hypothetical protein
VPWVSGPRWKRAKDLLPFDSKGSSGSTPDALRSGLHLPAHELFAHYVFCLERRQALLPLGDFPFQSPQHLQHFAPDHSQLSFQVGQGLALTPSRHDSSFRLCGSSSVLHYEALDEHLILNRDDHSSPELRRGHHGWNCPPGVSRTSGQMRRDASTDEEMRERICRSPWGGGPPSGLLGDTGRGTGHGGTPLVSHGPDLRLEFGVGL